jgi:hypothetical protein
MAHNVNLSLEVGIALHENIVDPVRLFEHDLDNLFPVGALVEENI